MKIMKKLKLSLSILTLLSLATGATHAAGVIVRETFGDATTGGSVDGYQSTTPGYETGLSGAWNETDFAGAQLSSVTTDVNWDAAQSHLTAIGSAYSVKVGGAYNTIQLNSWGLEQAEVALATPLDMTTNGTWYMSFVANCTSSLSDYATLVGLNDGNNEVMWGQAYAGGQGMAAHFDSIGNATGGSIEGHNGIQPAIGQTGDVMLYVAQLTEAVGSGETNLTIEMYAYDLATVSSLPLSIAAAGTPLFQKTLPNATGLFVNLEIEMSGGHGPWTEMGQPRLGATWASVVGAPTDPAVTDIFISPGSPAYQGESQILSAVGSGTSPLYYQWQWDNGTGGPMVNIPGATSSNYTQNTAGFTVGNTYNYQVIVTNILGSVTSDTAQLTITNAKSATIVTETTPASASRYVGGTVMFSASAVGNRPIAYQWQLNGGTGYTNIPGATSSTLVLTNLQYANAGSYQLTATNSVGGINGGTSSTPAPLTVLNPALRRLTWSAPVPFNDLDADQILTNVPGGTNIVGAAVFGGSEVDVTLSSGQVVDFTADGSVATTTGEGTSTSAYPADTANTTSNADFDSVLNEGEYDSTNGLHTITLTNLTPGQLYGVQLFALDDRSLAEGRPCYFLDGDDPAVSIETSATITMDQNAYIIGTFAASTSTQDITQELPDSGAGNINALVVRALPVNTDAATANFSASSSANTLNFIWDAGHIGWQLYTNSVGLAARDQWFPVSGSSAVDSLSIPINPKTPQVFFELRYP
jgi:hypothetical protein